MKKAKKPLPKKNMNPVQFGNAALETSNKPAAAEIVITDEIARRLLNADFGNIIRKVKSGKTLTEAEKREIEIRRKQVEEDSQRKHKRRIKEYEIDLDTALIRSGDLAEITGFSVRMLNLLSNEGHIPAAINSRHKLSSAVLGVVKYVRHLTERKKEAFRTAATKLKQLDIRDRQVDVNKKEGTVIDMDEAKRIYARCANATRVRLMAVGSALAPRVVGLSPGDIGLKADELIADALLELQNDLLKRNGEL